MNTKKTINVFRGLALIGCFMTVQHTAAQSWPGSQTGPNEGRWILNKDKSNSWAHLRLQVSNNKAWNIVNQEDLWWGYATNGTFTDTGTERMRLTTEGQLYVKGAGAEGTVRVTPDTAGGESAIGFFSNPDNTGVSWVVGHNGWDNPDDFTIGAVASGNSGVKFLVQTDGKVGIGTTSPSTTFDVNGTGHFSGNLGIGTTSPSQKLEVAGVTSSQGLRIPGRYSVVSGHSSSAIELEVATGDYNAIRGYNGNQGVGTIHFFDDTWGSGEPGNSAGAINISGDVATTIGNWNNPTAYFRKSDGHVGIGTTSPSTTFDVNGTGHFSGNVGIGTTSPAEKLEVAGKIKADGVVLNIGSFPDYVFEKDYPLMPLSEVEQYIIANKHLPGFPSEAEVVKNGANLGQLNNLLVEKVEELTLHTIAQEKLLNTQEKQINILLEELNTLKAEVKALKN